EDLKIITNRLEEIIQKISGVETAIKTIPVKKKRFSWLAR
ncbi:unnamed protein product, partial [marine sediment metagenome]